MAEETEAYCDAMDLVFRGSDASNVWKVRVQQQVICKAWAACKAIANREYYSCCFVESSGCAVSGWDKSVDVPCG